MAASASRSSGRAAYRSTISSGTTAAWRASGSSSAGTAIGTPAASSARRSTGSARRAERDSTAICDHGTPCCRCARRNPSAIHPASCAAEPNTRTSTTPSAAFAGARRRRPASPAEAGAGKPGREPGPGVADRRPGPVIHGEHGGGRLDRVQARGVGAAEPEHRLVRVAGEQDRPRRAAEHPDQLHLLRVEILGVVDQQVADPRPLGREQLGVAGQRIQRGTDELGGVERRSGGLGRSPARRTAEQHHLLVGAEEAAGRDPLRHVVPLPERLQLVRTQPAFRRPQEQLAQLGGEPRQPDRRQQPLRPARPRHRAARPAVQLPRQQIAHHGVLLGAREEPWRGVAAAGGVQPQHAEGVRVHGAHERLTGGARAVGGAVDEGGQPRPQLTRRPPAADEQQHPLRLGPGADVPGGRGQEQRRLAGARTADDAQRAGVVLEDPPRGRLPLRLRHRDARWPDEQGRARRRREPPVRARHDSTTHHRHFPAPVGGRSRDGRRDGRAGARGGPGDPARAGAQLRGGRRGGGAALGPAGGPRPRRRRPRPALAPRRARGRHASPRTWPRSRPPACGSRASWPTTGGSRPSSARAAPDPPPASARVGTDWTGARPGPLAQREGFRQSPRPRPPGSECDVRGRPLSGPGCHIRGPIRTDSREPGAHTGPVGRADSSCWPCLLDGLLAGQAVRWGAVR